MQPGADPKTLAEMLAWQQLPRQLLEYSDMAFCHDLPETKPEPIPPELNILMVIGAFSAVWIHVLPHWACCQTGHQHR